MGAYGDGSQGGTLSEAASREKRVMRKSTLIMAVLVILAGSSFVRAGKSLTGKLSADGPQAAEDQEAEKGEIARVVSSVIGWAKDKDLDLFFGSIAQDEDYISVTPGDRVIKRFEDVKQNVPFWMSPDFQYVRHELKDLEIKLARCGTVAWFYCVLDDINTYAGQPASWENARWTGVVEKRDGKWVVVSQHFSFASDK